MNSISGVEKPFDISPQGLEDRCGRGRNIYSCLVCFLSPLHGLVYNEEIIDGDDPEG